MSADWFPLEPGRYLKNTLHLTTRQHGGYWLLIMAALENDGRLPKADAALASIAKLDAKGWKEDGETLKAYLTAAEGHWLHEYAAFLCADVRARIGAKSSAGKKGAAKRWQGRANGKPMAVPCRSQSQTDAQLQGQEQGEPLQGSPPEEDSSRPIAARESAEGARTHDTVSIIAKIAPTQRRAV
jgi:uncharacterized protein YdaU (DUF1376 family)